jgi:GNAT superfamily N-acetyltransferase
LYGRRFGKDFVKLLITMGIVSMTFTVSTLRAFPDFADTVAQRGWQAWWTESDMSLASYRAGLDPMIARDGILLGLVAHVGETYLGSVLGIENDLLSRPQYSPWIAALWVDEAFRRQGVAAALIERARQEAARLGHQLVYLCAIPEKAPYYLKQGLEQIERDVDGLCVFRIKTQL